MSGLYKAFPTRRQYGAATALSSNPQPRDWRKAREGARRRIWDYASTPISSSPRLGFLEVFSLILAIQISAMLAGAVETTK
jgi:hypothetical protein